MHADAILQPTPATPHQGLPLGGHAPGPGRKYQELHPRNSHLPGMDRIGSTHTPAPSPSRTVDDFEVCVSHWPPEILVWGGVPPAQSGDLLMNASFTGFPWFLSSPPSSSASWTTAHPLPLALISHVRDLLQGVRAQTRHPMGTGLAHGCHPAI